MKEYDDWKIYKKRVFCGLILPLVFGIVVMSIYLMLVYQISKLEHELKQIIEVGEICNLGCNCSEEE